VLRADGSGPLAGVLLIHDEIIVPLKAAEMLVRSSLVIVVLGPGRVSMSPPGRSPPAREAHRGRERDFMAAGHDPQRPAGRAG
jgi:hypothetical protein